MGGSLSRLLSLIWTKKEIRILILGLVCRLCLDTRQGVETDFDGC